MPFRALIVSYLALLFFVGCGSEEEAAPGATTADTTPSPIQTIATVPETAPAIVTVYFLRDGKVGAASRAVVAGPQIGRAAIMELLEGPGTPERAAGLETAIPAGTRLESLSIADGLAKVRLSEPELTGEIVAQVVFTLTQFPTVREVVFGVAVDEERVGRADFEEFSPPVLVESPTVGEEVSGPLRITGTANTFEATFNVEVVDDQGNVLGKRFVTATSGSGTRGTFDAVVPVPSTYVGPGALVVFEISAEDGSRIHELEIPLQIGP